MERTFNYEDISIKNIEDNSQLIFICDADRKQVIVERVGEYE